MQSLEIHPLEIGLTFLACAWLVPCLAAEESTRILVGNYEYAPVQRMSDPAAALHHLTLEQLISGIPVVLVEQREAVANGLGGDPERLEVERGKILLVEGTFVTEEMTRLVYVENNGAKPRDAKHEKVEVRYFLAKSHRALPGPAMRLDAAERAAIVTLDASEWPDGPGETHLRLSWRSGSDGRMAFERSIEITAGRTCEFRIPWESEEPPLAAAVLFTNVPILLFGETFFLEADPPPFVVAIHAKPRD